MVDTGAAIFTAGRIPTGGSLLLKMGSCQPSKNETSSICVVSVWRNSRSTCWCHASTSPCISGSTQSPVVLLVYLLLLLLHLWALLPQMSSVCSLASIICQLLETSENGFLQQGFSSLWEAYKLTSSSHCLRFSRNTESGHQLHVAGRVLLCCPRGLDSGSWLVCKVLQPLCTIYGAPCMLQYFFTLSRKCDAELWCCVGCTQTGNG